MFLEVNTLLIKLACYSLNEVSEIFITSYSKYFNEIVIGGTRAMSLLPQLQCSPPERERD